MPFEILRNIAMRFAPNTTKKLQRTLSQAPIETTTQSLVDDAFASFKPRVGRNSLFLGLTSEQKEELGGVEYRASKLLLRIVYCVSSRSRRWDRDVPLKLIFGPVYLLYPGIGFHHHRASSDRD